jgi:hypothetical protein
MRFRWWFYAFPGVAFLAGLVCLILARYTVSTTAKYLEGVSVADGFRVTKALYYTSSDTYTWTAKESDNVVVPAPAVVGRTSFTLYYNPRNPSDASPRSELLLFAIGMVLVVAGCLGAIGLFYQQQLEETVSDGEEK